MSLTIEVKIEKTEFAFGEDPAVTLVLKNEGRAPLRIAKPEAGSGMPVARLVTKATGAETVTRPPMGFRAGLQQMVLDPGKTHTSFRLLSKLVTVPSPGDYILVVGYEWNEGTESAESEPLEFRVTGAYVRHLALDCPTAPYATATWVNPGANPAAVMVAEMALVPDGGMQPATPIGEADLNSRPTTSRPPDETPSVGRWVGWISKGTLRFVHQHETEGPGKTGSLKLPGPDAVLVQPLAAEAHTDRGTRGAGGALLWTPAGLVGVELTQTGSTPKAITSTPLPFPGKRPQWMQTHVLANTTRVFTAIRQEGEKVVLHAGLWPNPDSLVPPPSKKLEWPGVLVASGAAIGDGDLVRGATLIWMTDPEDGAKSLEVMTWTLASDGSAEDEPIGALDWPESVGIDACVVRVRRSGLPALLLRSPKDGWIAIDGLGHKGPLPIPYKDTTLPIDLAFFGEQEAVLIAAEYTGLITIKRLDGTGLPSRPH